MWFVWQLPRNKALNFNLVHTENYCQANAQYRYHLTKTIDILLLCAKSLLSFSEILISDAILPSLHERSDFANLIGVQETRYTHRGHIHSYLMWWLLQILYTITQSGCLEAVWCLHGLDTQLSVASVRVQRTHSPLQTDSECWLHADYCRSYKDRETDMLSVKWLTDSSHLQQQYTIMSAK